MSECQHCGCRAQLFLCQSCTSDLRDMLRGLVEGQELPSGHRGASWLQYLTDAALGQTRLGVSVRHSTDYTTPLPFNKTASDLLNEAHAMLARWVEIVNRNAETLAILGKDQP
ncbi:MULTISPECIES: hypothetical protein [Mycobacterium]|uniref:Uncharacterized protein n=2 Tax=Mycobacterium TaxID=1763 RepID=A0A2G5PQF9_MYCCE|nr:MULTISPECIES: hypothetical protein [Mycobacterium]EID12951.1 hypothetical protein MXEN_12111 [Mycobacterium xenopi RIVM700367]MCV7232780.1 hypothetical protein [Mycobacterium branderi]ORA40918.1 hypothetical protein BST20_01860 [Mycobacterium branderi]PIB80545.1 hypothetical protein CQY23_03120 [Mycobacterium celatum]BBZ09812.1 hypothetical protein MBRA_00070 [Mycobacterium branderi]